MRVAVIGLGEAGSLYAEGLATSGNSVTGFDPVAQPSLAGVNIAPTLQEGVDGADVVVSLVGAANSEKVASALLPFLRPGMVVADLNTSSPDEKRRVAEEVSRSGAEYLDVAVLAPVPRAGAGTPLMISGSGGDTFRGAFEGTGASIETVDGGPGAAAERKLLRSVFMKGLAGVVVESLEGARSADCEQWLRGQIVAELSGDASALVDRLESGSRTHAVRRKHETEDAARCLEALGTPSWMTRGASEWFSEFEKHL